ncbi:MAG: radical SAM protein [Spirochaetes bacterium]|nr:radical SAM protein [Spirochaetota bacterium]
MKKFLILDCYVDEPACLGVPPFVSPYPRLIAGALKNAGIQDENITYITIDHIRPEFKINAHYDETFIVGGAAVPGRYLGAKIGTFAEIKSIIENNNLFFSVGGLISRLPQFSTIDGNFRIIQNDIEAAAFHSGKDEMKDRLRNNAECAKWGILGASIVKSHQDYPELIAEIETYRGCPRENKCSFCSENIHSAIDFRTESDIISEIDALVSCGISRFRLGRQADITAYGSDLNSYKNGFPKSNPVRIRKLFEPLAEKIKTGEIKSLFIDNANPGQIATYEAESKEILSIIAESVSEGDTMALGAESFDPSLIKPNNLKADREEIINAIKIINEAGSFRKNGIPSLLPGINLIHGLIGETDKTFKLNYETLKEILDHGFLIKRINIRKIQPFPGTALYESKFRPSQRVINRYEYYKEKIRNEIDSAMLAKIYPAGTIIKEVRAEETSPGYTYARQIASYPIICKIPLELEHNTLFDAVILGNKERSLNALPFPIKINELNSKSMEYIPHVGKKTSDMIINKPLTKEKVLKITPNIPMDVLNKFKF